MKKRTLALIAGVSYLIIFIAAIFANFLVLDSLKSDPVNTVANDSLLIRLAVVAFLITAVFDVVVAWALKEIYNKHPLSTLSTYFRIIHAVIMGVAVFALLATVGMNDADSILAQVNTFDTIWLTGLFFFGVHLILLSQIIKKPKFIVLALAAAGVMYMVDTTAHFVLSDYDSYANIFLTLVFIPSVFGEMAFSVWLLVKGGKE